MSLDYFVEMYLSYRNDFLTVECFASYYDITESKARFIVDTGRAVMGYGEFNI